MSEIIFYGDEHKKHFYNLLEKYNVNINDNERVALFYILTITRDCRQNFLDCYEEETGCVRTDALCHGWVTGSDARAIRLALNLFSGRVVTAGDKSDIERYNLYNNLGEFVYNSRELFEYTPFSIFMDTCIGRYLLEGLKLRFPSLY